MKVCLVYPLHKPLDPSNWSGTPAGLAGGLQANGVEVVAIGVNRCHPDAKVASLLSRVGGSRGAIAHRTPLMRASRTRILRRSLSRAGDFDAVVAMGTEMYELQDLTSGSVPVATYDDGTLWQMWNNSDSDISNSGFDRKAVLRWASAQAESSRSASVCCVSTSWAARSFIDDYGVRPENVHVVGMGHRPRDAVCSNLRDWSVPKYLFVGADWRRKNGDAVLRAFTRIKSQVLNATLDLVGEHPKVLGPGIFDHGFLPRNNLAAQALLDRLYASSTAFVLPSKLDPSPIAYLEAASAGMAVVATTEGGASELLHDGAISVHPYDEEELFRAMLKLAEPEECSRRGALAAHHAANSSWAHVGGRILKALSSTERSDVNAI